MSNNFAISNGNNAAIIQNLIREQKSVISKRAKQQLENADIHPSEAFDCILEGKWKPAKEYDRVKFIYKDMIVFVALGESKGPEPEPQAIIVSVYLISEEDDE